MNFLQMLLIIYFDQDQSQDHTETSLTNLYQISWLEFDHLYVWWFEFDHSPNKKGMAFLTQYLSNLTNLLDFSCQLCLPIGLGSNPQWLSFYLSAQAQLFLNGQSIFPKRLSGWIHLACLCSEDLLVCPFFLLLRPLISCKLRFLEARIRRCLLAFAKLEGDRYSKERQSLFTLLAFLHF